MKAIAIKQPGGAENLMETEVPIPALVEGEVLIKVQALSVNPVDIKTRNGLALYSKLKDNDPLILGWDVAGEVVDVADGVIAFKKGDQVFGMVNFPGYGKAYAEYVAAPATQLAEKPALISVPEAAASTLAALTAWQVLVDETKVQPGERVLIHAAAGGVGHFAVQIAKYLDAYVIGTGSEQNHDFVKELGADEYVDYRLHPFEEVIKEVDVVFDMVGGNNPSRSLQCLKAGGRLVAIAGGVTDEVKSLAKEKNITASSYLVQSNGDDMEQIAELLEAGTIKAFVSKIFPFQQIAEAHRQLETGRTRGKVVVVI